MTLSIYDITDTQRNLPRGISEEYVADYERGVEMERLRARVRQLEVLVEQQDRTIALKDEAIVIFRKQRNEMLVDLATLRDALKERDVEVPELVTEVR